MPIVVRKPALGSPAVERAPIEKEAASEKEVAFQREAAVQKEVPPSVYAEPGADEAVADLSDTAAVLRILLG